MTLSFVLLALGPATAHAHGALYSPVPRNAADKDLPQFAGGRAPESPCTRFAA